jgi:DNA-directed RNA polymerase subunit E'/Rpb7
MKPYLTQRTIDLKMEMKPEQVDEHWETRLFLGICHKFQGRCTRQDGYLVSIRKILRIDDQHITRTNGNILFYVRVLAECILPKTGDCLDAMVDMIFPHGVFCHHHMLRMMMPMVHCKHFQIRQEFSTNSLYHPRTKQSIRKGDTVRVVIQDVRFENDLYSCIVSFLG